MNKLLSKYMCWIKSLARPTRYDEIFFEIKFGKEGGIAVFLRSLKTGWRQTPEC